MDDYKAEIWTEAREILLAKIQSLKKDLAAIQESANQETKSSAGDKYETGRAMAQQAIEQLTRRVSESESMLSQLLQINPTQSTSRVAKGSMLKAADTMYFISVPLGKIETRNGVCFCISPASPIGALFMGAKTGDVCQWQGNDLKIEVL